MRVEMSLQRHPSMFFGLLCILWIEPSGYLCVYGVVFVCGVCLWTVEPYLLTLGRAYNSLSPTSNWKEFLPLTGHGKGFGLFPLVSCRLAVCLSEGWAGHCAVCSQRMWIRLMAAKITQLLGFSRTLVKSAFWWEFCSLVLVIGHILFFLSQTHVFEGQG